MIAATVLSAGDSVRMGRPKALLELHGRTFLRTILDKAEEAGIGTVYVTAGPESSKVFSSNELGGACLVENAEFHAGPIGSIRSVLRVLPEEVEGLLIWPVDLPHVRTDTITALTNATTELPIVVPDWKGKRGHPIVFKKKIFREIIQLLPGRTARHVVRAQEERVFRVSVNDPAILDSINTPEDYERLVRSGRYKNR